MALKAESFKITRLTEVQTLLRIEIASIDELLKHQTTSDIFNEGLKAQRGAYRQCLAWLSDVVEV